MSLVESIRGYRLKRAVWLQAKAIDEIAVMLAYTQKLTAQWESPEVRAEAAKAAEHLNRASAAHDELWQIIDRPAEDCQPMPAALEQSRRHL